MRKSPWYSYCIRHHVQVYAVGRCGPCDAFPPIWHSLGWMLGADGVEGLPNPIFRESLLYGQTTNRQYPPAVGRGQGSAVTQSGAVQIMRKLRLFLPRTRTFVVVVSSFFFYWFLFYWFLFVGLWCPGGADTRDPRGRTRETPGGLTRERPGVCGVRRLQREERVPIREGSSVGPPSRLDLHKARLDQFGDRPPYRPFCRVADLRQRGE